MVKITQETLDEVQRVEDELNKDNKTIILELDKNDLISMILGKEPRFKNIELYSKYGTWIGGFSDVWVWYKSELEKLELEILKNMYYRLKDGR